MSLIDVRLQDLEGLVLQDLRHAWSRYYDTPAPQSMSRELLRLSIGYKLQEEAFGGLSRRTLLQISATKFNSETRTLASTSPPRPVPKSGTKLIREWHGKVHEVAVLEDGQFAYDDRRYRSLTVIARQITGIHQSGPRFFGIKATAATEVAGRNSLG
jgi:hypothetical protein